MGTDAGRYVDVVTAVLRQLGMLSASGTTLRVDSLTLVDLLVALEDASGLRIDVAELEADSFESVAALAETLHRIALKTT